MSNNKEFINIYLSKLGHTPLLEKQEEIDLSIQIRVLTIDLIRECLNHKSLIFLGYFLETYNKLNDNLKFLYKMSRKINNESTLGEVIQVTKTVRKLHKYIKDYLETENTDLVEKIIEHFTEISVTTMFIKNLINRLKSETENKELVKSIENIEYKIDKYRNQFVVANLRLVVSRAGYYLNNGLDFEDLIQEGNLGLLKAVDRFEHERGYRFSTYATWWVDQSIRRAISNKSQMIRIPVHIQDSVSKVEKAINVLTAKKGTSISIDDIVEESGLSKERVTQVKELVTQPMSMETEITNDLQLKDLLPSSDSSNDPYICATASLRKKSLMHILSTLSPRNQKILRLRFGIGEVQDHTLQEISNALGLTRERIRQIEVASLKTLRKRMRS